MADTNNNRDRTDIGYHVGQELTLEVTDRSKVKGDKFYRPKTVLEEQGMAVIYCGMNPDHEDYSRKTEHEFWENNPVNHGDTVVSTVIGIDDSGKRTTVRAVVDNILYNQHGDLSHIRDPTAERLNAANTRHTSLTSHGNGRYMAFMDYNLS